MGRRGDGNGQRPGGSGQSDRGGGGPAQGGGPGETQSAKEDFAPETTRAAGADNPGGDSVAPTGQPQSDLFIRNLEQALKDSDKTKDLEKDTGYTREQLDQFTRQYKKLKSAPAGPGRDIDAKPDDLRAAAQPSANLPGLDASTPFSSQTRRAGGTAAQDQLRDNVEGARFEPPADMRGKWQGYKNRLLKVPAPRRSGAPRTKPGP
jgi:hypothetical protein